MRAHRKVMSTGAPVPTQRRGTSNADMPMQESPVEGSYYGFQLLPAEVRVKIWEEAYVIKKPGGMFIGSSKNGRATDGDGLKKEVNRYSGHAARQLCKKFNDEILDLVYHKNGFEFFRTSVLLEFMESAGARARSWITSIKIHFSLNPVAARTSHAAQTAYKGLRYLKSCTRLVRLEIDARIIPYEYKACWLSFPVVNPFGLIFDHANQAVKNVQFGPEERNHWKIPRHHFLYPDFQQRGNTSEDKRMIAMTKRMVSKAIEKVADEFHGSSKSKRKLPNVFEGSPKAWKGVPPKEKARLFKLRAESKENTPRQGEQGSILSMISDDEDDFDEIDEAASFKNGPNLAQFPNDHFSRGIQGGCKRPRSSSGYNGCLQASLVAKRSRHFYDRDYLTSHNGGYARSDNFLTTLHVYPQLQNLAYAGKEDRNPLNINVNPYLPGPGARYQGYPGQNDSVHQAQESLPQCIPYEYQVASIAPGTDHIGQDPQAIFGGSSGFVPPAYFAPDNALTAPGYGDQTHLSPLNEPQYLYDDLTGGGDVPADDGPGDGFMERFFKFPSEVADANPQDDGQDIYPWLS